MANADNYPHHDALEKMCEILTSISREDQFAMLVGCLDACIMCVPEGPHRTALQENSESLSKAIQTAINAGAVMDCYCPTCVIARAFKNVGMDV